MDRVPSRFVETASTRQLAPRPGVLSTPSRTGRYGRQLHLRTTPPRTQSLLLCTRPLELVVVDAEDAGTAPVDE